MYETKNCPIFRFAKQTFFRSYKSRNYFCTFYFCSSWRRFVLQTEISGNFLFHTFFCFTYFVFCVFFSLTAVRISRSVYFFTKNNLPYVTLRSVAFCSWTISLSLSPAEGHFVVETRLAKIHVCTSNENAYQERRVSYLGGVFDGLK